VSSKHVATMLSVYSLYGVHASSLDCGRQHWMNILRSASTYIDRRRL